MIQCRLPMGNNYEGGSRENRFPHYNAEHLTPVLLAFLDNYLDFLLSFELPSKPNLDKIMQNISNWDSFKNLPYHERLIITTEINSYTQLEVTQGFVRMLDLLNHVKEITASDSSKV